MTLTFVNFPRAPDPEQPIKPKISCTKTYLRRTRWGSAWILPYVYDFMLFASTEKAALTLRHRLAQLLTGSVSSATPPRAYYGLQRKSDATWVST
jgi:hypothetical protein